MAFNINEFKGNVNNFGRTALFDVEFTLPPFLNGIIDPRELSFRASSVNAPGVFLETTAKRRAGTSHVEFFPFSVGFNDLTVAFLCDDQGKIINLFKEWVNYIFPIDDEGGPSNYRVAYRSQYTSTITIRSYSEHASAEGNPIPTLEYKFFDAFPERVADVQFNWGSFNEILTQQIEFKYRTYKPSRINAEIYDVASQRPSPRNNQSVYPVANREVDTEF